MTSPAFHAIVILTLAVFFSQGTQGRESIPCVYINGNSWQSLAGKLNVSFQGRKKQRLGWGA